jgi:hypothetical protein
MTPATSMSEESLTQLLGGRRGALDATLPPLAFVAGYVAGAQSVGVGVAAALVVSLGVAAWRLAHGDRPRAVAVGVLSVALAAYVALRTGRAADFFVIRIAVNAVSAMAWLASIAVRWPLLGVVVGLVLGQKSRWRRDPALLRAYGLASWVWVLQYLIRVLVLVPLWSAGEVVALGVAQTVLTWPLVAVCLALSWWVIRRSLPPEHPGLRHPVPVRTFPESAD